MEPELEALLAATRAHLDAAVDRRMLILRGLADAGQAEGFSAEETALLEDGREDLDAALADHPGLEFVVAQAASDVRLFEEAWNEALSGDRPASIPSRRRRGMRWPARAAMGLSAAALLAVLYLAVVEQTGRTTITAPATATQVVSLDDGSSVRLAPGATLTYTSRNFDRTVRLEGRAFFDIVPESQGFSVETSTAHTTVLGTRFGVVAEGRLTEVVLVSGRVAVTGRSGKKGIVVLEPGERTEVARDASPEAALAVDVADALAWTRLLILRDTPMSRVVGLLAETRQASVTLDPTLEDVVVTGTFAPEQDTAEILEILAATLGAEVSETVNGFLITPQR